MSHLSRTHNVLDIYPDKIQALRFIRDSVEGPQGDPLSTGAFRYWPKGDSVFITHFKWPRDIRGQAEMNVVDAWIRAYNVIEHVVQVQHAVRQSTLVPPQHKLVGSSQKPWWNHVQLIHGLHLHSTAFLNYIQSEDFDLTGRSAWYTAEAKLIRRSLPAHIDATLPDFTLPFQVLGALIDTLAEDEPLSVVWSFVKPLDISLIDRLAPSEGAWRQQVLECAEPEGRRGEDDTASRSATPPSSPHKAITPPVINLYRPTTRAPIDDPSSGDRSPSTAPFVDSDEEARLISSAPTLLPNFPPGKYEAHAAWRDGSAQVTRRRADPKRDSRGYQSLAE